MWGPTFPPDSALDSGALATDLAFRAPWRLISASFLHLSALQLVVSLGALKSQGDALEDKIGMFRLLSGVCGHRRSRILLEPVLVRLAGAGYFGR